MAYHPFRHLGLKILSIALAGALWLTVGDQRAVERTMRVPLEYHNLPAKLELMNSPPDTVEVRLRGPSGTIGRLLPGEVVAVLDLTSARSGTRYNITTGRDDNGDTVFNDRPAGVARNSAIGKGSWDVAARLSYTFGFGDRPADGPGGPGPTMIVQRVGAGPGSAGDLLGGLMGGGAAENKRVRIELFVSAQNLLNSVTPIGYSGVMTSPFFLQPTAAMPARRVDLGFRVGF